MKRSTSGLFYGAIGISAAVHVALLVFLPYKAVQPPLSPARELIPVVLLHRQVPEAASQVPAGRQPRTDQDPTPAQESPPQAAVPEVAPAAEEPPQPAEAAAAAVPEAPAPAEGLPEEPGRSTERSTERSAESPPAEPRRSAEGPVAVSPESSSDAAGSKPVAPGAEIAAYQAILSTLRGRIVREIRYPAIARASGWKGTVVLSVHLDSAGRLEQTIVRRSSGYEVLDRAAAALLRKVTPVSNPLSRPVSIEIPIVYELK
ncbi:MAG: energy transducer TonB [Spirochaetes bacterium]|nr:energy transducer TonB [Spirochaetota bacterium]